MLVIDSIEENSIGEELGFECGDAIVAFDGHEAVDLLDYLYYDNRPFFTVTVRTVQGEEVSVEIEKDDDESLGLTFKDDMLETRLCHNNCLFCFVRQMPKGMRETLYVKDDDYRQSFLMGNFVTLTNATEQDIERIIRLQLSPLYISVHTMNEELRCKLLNNRFAGRITDYLKRFEDSGIEVNAQIVLVPGINDGDELTYSLEQLYALKNIKSVAVVPCGITKFREGLYPINDIDKTYARRVIEQVESVNNRHGAALVNLADEFFFKAGLPLPCAEYYGGFTQIENGVGMSVKFKNDVEEILKNSKKQVLPKGHYLTVCGTSVYNFMLEIIEKVCSSCKGVEIDLVAVENKFFGSTVNCTGLLTGIDIVNAVKEREFDTLLIPNNCLREMEDVFLDGMTIEDMSAVLNKKVIRAKLNN